MAALVEISAEDGALLFEGEFTEGELAEVSFADKVDDVVKATDKSIASVAATIRRAATGIAGGLQQMASDDADKGSLKGFEIEMGIKITGEGNVIVAKGSAEGNLRVKVSWEFK
jgi:hypothetical protein